MYSMVKMGRAGVEKTKGFAVKMSKLETPTL